MEFTRVLLKTWNENFLFSALVELTYRCNLDCFFCYNDLNLKGVPLGTEEYCRFFEDLRDMQCMNLILTGGEPLAHPDFLRLGSKARELGFVIRLKSNGHALRGRLARRLKEEIDPFVVDLSLHGACPETHDRQTRVRGSFERLMANIPELLALGLPIKLNCTMTRWNENETEAMFAIADGLGVPLAINATVSPRDDGDAEPLSIAPSSEGKGRLFRLLAARSAARQEGQETGGEPSTTEMARPADDGMLLASSDKNCGAGVSAIAVDPFGNVLPCVQWRRPIGNLHDQSIKEIWGSSTGLREVRDLNGAAKRLVDSHGPNGRLMAFCPGLAEMETGRPLAVYPSASEQMEILAQLRSEERPTSLPVVY